MKTGCSSEFTLTTITHAPLSQGGSAIETQSKSRERGFQSHVPPKVAGGNLPSRDPIGSRCPPDSGGRECSSPDPGRMYARCVITFDPYGRLRRCFSHTGWTSDRSSGRLHAGASRGGPVGAKDE